MNNLYVDMLSQDAYWTLSEDESGKQDDWYVNIYGT